MVNVYCVFASQDRHTVGHSPPVLDKKQDWELLYGEENEFGTVLKFVRKINTCDKDEDKEIPVRNSIFFNKYCPKWTAVLLSPTSISLQAYEMYGIAAQCL